MASERMGLGRSWQQRFDRRPDSIEHVGLERAHDVGDLHLVVDGVHQQPIGPCNDRWMVAYPRGLYVRTAIEA